MRRIGPDTLLPARRSIVTLTTADGLRLAGELALPADREPSATVVLLHPNPLGGGSMDTHLIRKAAARLPALAGLATFRFNTRGTASESGASEGEHGDGVTERADVRAALDFVADLPAPWLAAWSFGTDLALMHGCDPRVRGAVLMAPTLRRSSPEHLAAWAAAGKPVRCLVPEFDDYLRPPAARERFAAVPQAEVIEFTGAKHLFVGYAEEALDSLVELVAPEVELPLPRHW
ncbi:alpha/beta hydrolase [Actinokineospora sp. NBRC 105648]|uniref:alpha/beta hydrolase n=1 Tax=Actinokineospora sp. NBRC 105648 TaxID=3032206 RepID=UPI0024A12800|nr:alpha/beta hydrolase [Actinokineospora sp. NBRC 105648]GLZ42664.1 hypothetical protein Acsp05_62880 [Actinokineospora sp. NBRC 105648]